MEHTKSHTSSLRNIQRVLSGRGFITVPRRDINFLDDPINYIRLKKNKEPIEYGAFAFGHINTLTRKGWHDLIETSGLKIVTESTIENPLLCQIIRLVLYLLYSHKNFNELPIGMVPFKAFQILSKVWNFVGYFDPVIYKENWEILFYILILNLFHFGDHLFY